MSEISLKYRAKRLKNYCILKVLYESLMMIQRELKHVAV